MVWKFRVRQGGPRRYLHRYTATPGESGEGWVPSHSRVAVFSPMVLYVFMGLWKFQQSSFPTE